jgi:hypothetical protein
MCSLPLVGELVKNVPTGGHGWACALIANGQASVSVHLLNDLKHAMEKAILFNNYEGE